MVSMKPQLGWGNVKKYKKEQNGTKNCDKSLP